MVSNLINKNLKKLFWQLGYHVNKIDEIQTLTDDPREIPYLKKLPYVVVNLPIELGMGLKFYPLTGITYHPLILALKNSGKDFKDEKSAQNMLKVYSELVRHNSANDFLGFTEEKVFPHDSHPYEYTYPWSTTSPKQMKEFHVENIRDENKRYGFNSYEFLEAKIVSKKKIHIETIRLLNLIKSVHEKGYHPQYHDALNCYVLLDKEKWKWYVESGQHRASVLAALEYKEIPVHVRQIIRREDVCIWPAVQSGLYSQETALKLFDNLFHAKPPSFTKEWRKYVDNLAPNF